MRISGRYTYANPVKFAKNLIRFSLSFGVAMMLTFPAHAAPDEALPPVGSVCWSIPTKHDSGIIYERKCKYPDGTTWECSKNLNICKKITREILRNNRPTNNSSGSKLAPRNSTPNTGLFLKAIPNQIIAPNN